MAKRKRRRDTMSGVTVGGIVGLSAVGVAQPALSSSATASTLGTSYATGVGHVGATLPTMGKLRGTGMVLKATKKLRKKSRRII